uniref:Heat shock protein 70 n=1 Tax=Panagrolaimus sp. ES5 TaxID=591445 RepID=A0AC34FDG4_9BILA
MAEYSDVIEYDAKTIFDGNLVIKTREKEILTLDFQDSLPITELVKLELEKSEYVLYVCVIQGGYLLCFIPFLDLPDLNFEANCFDILKRYVFPKNISIADRKYDVVGIDLGTSFCCAAINRANGIDTIALGNIGERILPSYVSYDEENPKCGQVVINRLQNHAKSTVFDAKRIIGKNYTKIKKDESWCFEVVGLNIAEMEQLNGKSENFEIVENDSCLIKSHSIEGEILKYPEEISAVLLKYIKQKSEEFQGKLLSEAVITVPAAFSESQRVATHDAALIADVCIFKVSNSKIQVISQSGDCNLGGRDFDNILIQYFKQKLLEIYGISVPEEKKYKQMLQCQKIKEDLSVIEKYEFDVQEINCEIEEFIPITRKKFEELSKNLLKRIKDTVQVAVNQSKLYHIDKILQVGGGCRMPIVKSLLKEIFENSEICCEDHPEEVVARGAAYYAYYLNLIVSKEKFGKDSKKCSIM